jgi:hypothetical protein
MSERELSIIAGALSRVTKKPTTARAQEAIAKRWRASPVGGIHTPRSSDVIPLLDGWIRRLEREAGADLPSNR